MTAWLLALPLLLGPSSMPAASRVAAMQDPLPMEVRVPRMDTSEAQLAHARGLKRSMLGRPEAAPVLPATGGGDFKTTVLLALADRPGALYHVLRPLSEARLNLTKIESRPSRRRAWDYVFFIDLDGHAAMPEVQAVLEDISSTCQVVKVLGSYRKADLR